MNTVLIVFLVVVIIVAIIVVIQYYNPGYLIMSPKSLNAPSQSIINASQLESPGSVRYYYTGWVFINSNSPISSANVLFNRGNDFVVALTGSTLGIYINTKSKSAPYSDGSGNGVSAAGVLDTSGLFPLLTVPNFPFQKWCQLVINVDGTTVDLYIDGKFVQTVQSSKPISTNTADNITYGNQYTVGHIVRFSRPATSINPQGVWNSYMLGSGQSYTLTDYHLDAQLTKNKNVSMQQRLV
jgi:hypothetical protein